MAQNGPVIIATIVSGRTASFRRLVRSLLPLWSDPDVHLVVFYNGMTSGCPDASEWLAGHTAYDSTEERLPLHLARVRVSQAVERFAVAHSIVDAAIWLVDDDVSFERVAIVDGRLAVENVAVERIRGVRCLRERSEYDLVVSGFTGDPPVRPNAVVSDQLFDLDEALSAVANNKLDAQYEAVSPELRLYSERDYYYAHREVSNASSRIRYPWLRRHGRRTTVREEIACMMSEARGISIGRGVFRPLVETLPPAAPYVVADPSPPRGGNAIFFGVEALMAHRYPSFPIGGGYSRRADMIGTSLLARAGARVGRGNLTLRHDRRGQPAITCSVNEWLQEFAGVVLARLLMTEPGMGSDVGACVRRLVDMRAVRILQDAQRVVSAAESTLATIAEPSGTWWRSECCSAVARALTDDLERVLLTFRRALDDGVIEQLRQPDTIRAIVRGHAEVSANGAR